MNDYCYFCGKVGASYSMKRPGYATEEVSIHKGCYLAPKAEGLAPKEPEQSSSLPSGVVEVAMKVFGDFTYEALRHHKERSTRVKEFHAATNLIWDALRALPQAPAAPAAAPVEVRYEHLAHDDEMWASDEVEYEPGKWDMVGAKWMGEKYKDGMKRVRRKVPAPGSQGVEAPRKEARECWIVESKRETLVFWDKNKARCELQFYDADEEAEIIPMREVSEGGTSGPLCSLDDLYTAISERDEARAAKPKEKE